MNLSKWIGATVRHQRFGRFKIKSLEINDAGVVLAFGNECVAPLEDCKRIRIVKRKKSQVLVEALEHIKESTGDCCMDISPLERLLHYEEIAQAALEKYREKTKGEK